MKIKFFETRMTRYEGRYFNLDFVRKVVHIHNRTQMTKIYSELMELRRNDEDFFRLETIMEGISRFEYELINGWRFDRHTIKLYDLAPMKVIMRTHMDKTIFKETFE